MSSLMKPRVPPPKPGAHASRAGCHRASPRRLGKGTNEGTPVLSWVAASLLIAGAVFLLAGALLIALPRPQRVPGSAPLTGSSGPRRRDLRPEEDETVGYDQVLTAAQLLAQRLLAWP
jgi:hypothetical protein